jgi:hypothetical protein
MNARLLALGVLLTLVASVQAKDKDAALITDHFFAAEYLSGPAAVKPFRGSLEIEASGVHVTDARFDEFKGWVVKHHRVTTVFTIPIGTIAAVAASSKDENRIGLLHLELEHVEYVTITTETATGADVAKINFAVKHAQKPTVTP